MFAPGSGRRLACRRAGRPARRSPPPNSALRPGGETPLSTAGKMPVATLALFWVLACFALCSGLSATASQGRSALLRERIYARATNEFRLAALFKPRGTNEDELSFKLAPLILQEVSNGAAELAKSQVFGTLTGNNGAEAVDRRRPAVYYHASTAMANGRPHARLCYFWFYSADPVASGPSLPAQGIRITLDSSGQPAIWEMLADSSDLNLIFISQKLESAAAAQFGAVLPGRRFAVERGTNDAPQAVVARVLDDAPLPMGPIIYLDAQSRSASTVTCRCMPVQVRQLARTETYDLLSMDSVLHLWPVRPHEEKGTETPRFAFWPGEAQREQKLERCLRLPSQF